MTDKTIPTSWHDHCVHSAGVPLRSKANEISKPLCFVMMLTIRPLLRLLRIRAGRYFIVLMALAIAACFHAVAVNAQGYTNSFLYPFNPAVSKISFTPFTRQGFFRESDTIT